MLTQLLTERYRLYSDYYTKLGVSVLLLHATAVVIASLVVVVCTATILHKMVCILPILCIYAFHMITTINIHYFFTQNSPIGPFNGSALCCVCDKKLILP
jgi:hypothetical protein